MAQSRRKAGNRGGIRHVLVITGDHSLPEATKMSGGYSEEDLELHRKMCAALESLPGHEFEFLTDHSRFVSRLRDEEPRPELVLNFCDAGFRNQATQELHVPALCELLGIPYTGAAPAAMVLCYDKAIVRLVARAHGVPTPEEIFLGADQPFEGLEVRYPALIKPAQGDGSVGITRNAVVHSDDDTRRYLEWFRQELPGRAALVQEYLPGPEFGLAFIGNPGARLEALPILEVDFSELPEGLPPILAFESKTGPETPYEKVRLMPASLPQATIEKLRRYGEILFERLGCRDYARFDFRTAGDGEIKLMEVNPNPAWSAAAKLAIMAGFAGKSYPEMLSMILEASWARLRKVSAEP